MNGDQITFYKSADKGSGLPFGILDHQALSTSDDLFTPSLRDFHVVFWFKKGTGTYFIDFQEYHFQPNTIVLLSKDQVHYFAPFQNEHMEIQSVVFNPEFVYRNDTDLRHLFQFTMANHMEGVQILNLAPEDNSSLEMISKQMKTVFQNWNGTSQRNAFYHWLCLFLIHCEQMQILCEKEIVVDENQKLILEFNQLLERHYRKEFKVDFYVNKMGITIKALSKLTKERYKLPPKAVINERRILEIKRQLKGTTKPTKNIAYDLGFDEPTNMVKYFKKYTNLTPNAFRIENS